MMHWGWYWRIKNTQHMPRILCPMLPKIDSFLLFKDNKLKGFTVEPFAIKAQPMPDHLKITYRKHKNFSYTIPIEKQPCNYGGFRCFFKCPLCQQRMRFLYFASQSVFLCRKCLNLSYESQRLRPERRYGYMSKKIKDHLEKKGGDLYEKPPRMHNKTFQRLKNKSIDYEIKSYQALNKELREWYGSRSMVEKFFDCVD